ncbi:hypothetical protein [Aliiroseovarius sp. PrR006]|uniref:hypothetical protein n=1 Tax=Aliiroseovarius sp. PrR006 TaxID=2706883 RepID=UPI0013D3648D|nr:hypothetical protein [Aliiroseovarius sp. PrR006]NDW53287.1 hypothetical protein [Aliiroseovarius sp. PrR006]
MKLRIGMAFAFTLAALAGCQSNSGLESQFLLRTSTVTACGPAAAARVEQELAAVETLRRGYDRFQILRNTVANSTRASVTGPTHANPYATVDTSSTSANGNVTYFGNQRVAMSGAHEAMMYVQMFKPRDRGYKTATDARAVLGADWKAIVARGIYSCN